MAYWAVFSQLIAELDTATIPRKYIMAVILIDPKTGERSVKRDKQDITDYMDCAPRFAGLLPAGVIVDYARIQQVVELEVEWTKQTVERQFKEDRKTK